MARLSKEDVARLDGLQMALEIVEKGGVDALRDEVKWRCNNRVCPPVKKQYVLGLVAELTKPEKMFLSCATAYTLTYEMNMPPSMIKKYLTIMNARMDAYRMDKNEFEKDCSKLDSDSVMMDVAREWLEEETGHAE